MRSVTRLLVLGLLVAAVAACSGDSGDSTGKGGTTTPPNEQDAESGMPDDTESGASDDDYPIDTCVVSGELLGSMGEPVVLEHNGTTVKLCCDGCVEEFESDPDKYVAKLKK